LSWFFSRRLRRRGRYKTFGKWGGVIFDVLMENLIWDSLSKEVKG
jgi:hypothetical protein